MKKFLITIDTEGDNLWAWKIGDSIRTENVIYLSRFQDLCDKYSFKPVWLSNYEMLMDERYIDFINGVIHNNRGECGMHLHAWNTPPYYELPYDNTSGAPYLIEYPLEIMDEKIKTMTELIIKKTGIKPISHRAGRWATNEQYFSLLVKHGYKVDCSITPGIDWSNNRGQSPNIFGSDYSHSKENFFFINEKLMEIPITVKNSHHLFLGETKSPKALAKNVFHSFRGQNIWLRPDGNNLDKMLSLLSDETSDYKMFMLHSSEMMPGGSPTFKDANSVEKLYKDIDSLFKIASKRFYGVTLAEYYNMKSENKR